MARKVQWLAVCSLWALAVTVSCGQPVEAGVGAETGQSETPEQTAQMQLPVNSASWNTLGNVVAGTAGNGKVGATNTTTSDGPYGLELWVKPSGVTATRALLIDTASPPNLIGGYSSNSVTAGVTKATIAGGGASAATNKVTDEAGTVGGGVGNQAGDNAGTTSDRSHAVVGGGYFNTASGLVSTCAGGENNVASGWASTIGGGSANSVSGVSSTCAGGELCNITSDWTTVGGGYDNEASAASATIAGGESNTASGIFSAIPGGTANIASGTASLAAGQNANANFDGCFVWADDSTATQLSCGAANKFVARAAGGVFFYSNSGATTGVKLTAGAGAWASVSDRNSKTSLTPVTGQEVLRRVAALPLSTWSYKSEPGVKHMGPMAQDFRAAFGLGSDDVSIVTVDADGVALAAIQGLNEKTTNLEADVKRLSLENAALKERLERLEQGRQPTLAGMASGGMFGFAGLVLCLFGVLLGRRRHVVATVST